MLKDGARAGGRGAGGSAVHPSSPPLVSSLFAARVTAAAHRRAAQSQDTVELHIFIFWKPTSYLMIVLTASSIVI